MEGRTRVSASGAIGGLAIWDRRTDRRTPFGVHIVPIYSSTRINIYNFINIVPLIIADDLRSMKGTVQKTTTGNSLSRD